MPRYHTDKCTGCGNITSPELLTIKRAVFYARTSVNKAIRNRTVGWFCETCRDADPDWNREAFNAPGHTSQGLENAKVIRGQT